MKGIDSMASIIKRGKSYRAQVSIYKKGEHKKLSQQRKMHSFGH